MRVLRFVALSLLAGVLACTNHGRPDRPVTVRLLARWPGAQDPDAALEIAGKTGDAVAVDVPLADLHDGMDVSLVYQTACGPKKTTFPLSPGTATPADKYQRKEFDYLRELAIPPDLKRPAATTLLFDPKLTGDVVIGKDDFKVADGVPAGVQQYRRWDGVSIRDAECVDRITVDGVDAKVPRNERGSGEKALFVTAREQQCFLDEDVGYGDARSAATKLAGARVYALRGKPTFFFRPADDNVDGSRSTTGVSLEALNECQ